MANNNQNIADKIKCPECGKLILITETLQHQLTESVRAEYEEKISVQESVFSEREKRIAARAKELDDKEEEIETRVQKSLKTELEKHKIIINQEARKAAEESVAVEIKDLREDVKTKNEKLEEARKIELTLRKRERELEERAKDVDLEVARKMDSERKRVEEETARRIIEERRLKDAEKDKKMSDMMGQIEDLKRKAEQGSQQMQGEVQELDLEKLLKELFPFDEIIPVPKGVRGADIIQKVNTNRGAWCGSILWESKRTNSWNDSWIGKLKDDQREAKADIAAIVSRIMPKDVLSFGRRGDVWITKNEFVFGLAALLRETLIQVAATKLMSESKDEKIEILFRYLTGSEFKQKVEAVADAFVVMKTDLEKEKRATITRWAKQEKHLEQAIGSIAGMHGDLRGLIGSSMQVIPLLEADDEDEKNGELESLLENEDTTKSKRKQKTSFKQ